MTAGAVRVAERDGPDGLSVAAVAEELGCRPPSVYHHVPGGLDGLRALVADVAADTLVDVLDAAGAASAGLDAVFSTAEAATEWADKHRGLTDVLARYGSQDAHNELLGPWRYTLSGAGVPEARAGAMAQAFHVAMLSAAAISTSGFDAKAGRDRAVATLLYALEAAHPAKDRAA